MIHPYLLLLLMCGITRPIVRSSPDIWIAPIGGSTPTFVTFPDGHDYTVISSGPILGAGGQLLGIGIAFLSPSSDVGLTTAAARELVGVVDIEATEREAEAIIVMAYFSFDPNAGPSSQYNFGFERASGHWELKNPPRELPQISPDIARLLAGWGGFGRKPVAEKTAVQIALRWLALLDRGNVREACSVGSLLRSADWLPDDCASFVEREFLGRGSLQKRTETYRLYTRRLEHEHAKTFVLVSFTSRFGSGSRDVSENILLFEADNGGFRVAGMLVRH